MDYELRNVMIGEIMFYLKLDSSENIVELGNTFTHGEDIFTICDELDEDFDYDTSCQIIASVDDDLQDITYYLTHVNLSKERKYIIKNILK